MLDLEALRHRIEPLAGEHVVTLGALLVEPDADRVARADLEAAGAIQSLDQFVDGGVRQPFPHATLDDRHQTQLDLSRRDPGPITRLHVAALARRADRVGLENLLDGDPADRLLGPAQDLAGLWMTELSTLAIESQPDPREDAVATAERERDGGALDFDHLAVDLRKERHDLIDEHAQAGRRGLRSRRPGAPESHEQGEGDDASHRAHAGTDASISPRLAQGVGRVKEWAD